MLNRRGRAAKALPAATDVDRQIRMQWGDGMTIAQVKKLTRASWPEGYQGDPGGLFQDAFNTWRSAARRFGKGGSAPNSPTSQEWMKSHGLKALTAFGKTHAGRGYYADWVRQQKAWLREGKRTRGRRARRASNAFALSVPAEWLREHIRRNALGDEPLEDWLDDLRERFGSELDRWPREEVLASISEILADELD